VIIGAGVIGLAIGRCFSEAGLSVLIIEKEGRSGESTSSRNSGVIHAGMYYPDNTLKAKLCVEGNSLLYEYASKKRIDHKKIGKYIVACSKTDLEKLDSIYDQGIKNGVEILKVTKEEIESSESDLSVCAGLFSPNTGIIDVPELLTALEGDIQHNSGMISFSTKCEKVERRNDIFVIHCSSTEDFKVESKFLINCAGLDSENISNKMSFLDKRHIHKINLAKGHYFKYSGKNPFKKLIYPIHNESSLGIHVGFDLSGQLRFGPDLSWISEVDYSFDETLKSKFVKEIQSYWKNLDPNKLHPDYTGIRPKVQRKGEKMKDFIISDCNYHGIKGLVNLQGIESPGVTSSLAIAEYVKDLTLN